jgi:hypothetical protein
MGAASDDDGSTTDTAGEDPQPAVGARVRLHPRTDTESPGVIVDDFGEMSGRGVDVGANQIATPARRWAVALDDGALALVDSDQMATEQSQPCPPLHTGMPP